jgi:hypothetical protein
VRTEQRPAVEALLGLVVERLAIPLSEGAQAMRPARKPTATA